MRIGLDEMEWEATKVEIRELLVERAGFAVGGGLISYSELSAAVTAATIDPHSPVLANLLGEISEEEDMAGRGMLSAIVVHKGDKRPGGGFYELAKRLGRNFSGNAEEFWFSEIDRVQTYWSE